MRQWYKLLGVWRDSVLSRVQAGRVCETCRYSLSPKPNVERGIDTLSIWNTNSTWRWLGLHSPHSPSDPPPSPRKRVSSVGLDQVYKNSGGGWGEFSTLGLSHSRDANSRLRFSFRPQSNVKRQGNWRCAILRGAHGSSPLNTEIRNALEGGWEENSESKGIIEMVYSVRLFFKNVWLCKVMTGVEPSWNGLGIGQTAVNGGVSGGLLVKGISFMVHKKQGLWGGALIYS